MEPLFRAKIDAPLGDRWLEVYCADASSFDMPLDVLTVSAFIGDYMPVPRTLIGALDDRGISVERLAAGPLIDLRELCGVWLSGQLEGRGDIRRIGCVEMSRYTPDRGGWRMQEERILSGIAAYFRMLDVAAAAGVPVETVALPLLGAGCQGIEPGFTLVPLAREIAEFLRRTPGAKRVIFIQRDIERARMLADVFGQPSFAEMFRGASHRSAAGARRAFISYSSRDEGVVRQICAQLEANRIDAWYSGRNLLKGDYASEIVSAIDRSEVFVPLLSENSMQSNHVLNEVDLAFSRLAPGRLIMPLRMDGTPLRPAFEYYLSRFEYTDIDSAFPERGMKLFLKRVRSNA